MADLGLLGIEDPRQLGLLSLGLRLMSTPGKFGTALGQSGLGALGDMQGAVAAKQRADMQKAQMAEYLAQAKQREAEVLHRAAQDQEMKRKAQQLEQAQIGRQNYLGSIDPSTGPALPFNSAQAMRSGLSVQEIQALSPAAEEPPFKNLGSPGDYTPESVAAYVTTKNPAVLRKAAPNEVPTPHQKEYKQAVEQGYKGSIQQWLLDLQRASAPRVPPAPSLTQVIDPLDSSKLITVDARTWNPVTRVGLVGVAGKEPTASLRETATAKGKENVDNIVTDLKSQYDVLEKKGGIPSTTSNVPANVLASLRASGVGQTVGGWVGSEEQSARNKILMTRPLLVQAIKSATGMTAKQMDSNAELKLLLMTATDPKLDVQANKSALDKLDSLYGLSGNSGSKNNIKIPSGIDQEVWRHMTPEERSLWKN